jgi:lipopolysaccharide assembly outer membrane protein LptD (OstA)
MSYFFSHLVFFLILISSVCADENTQHSTNKDVKINADNIDYYSEGKRAEAEGNVRLEHKIKEKKLSLKSKKLIATFDEKGNLSEAEATGDVVIEYDGTVLKAEVCNHSFSKQKTVCESDHVYVIQGPNELHGQIATLDFGTQVFTMHSTSGSQIDGKVYTKKIKE